MKPFTDRKIGLLIFCLALLVRFVPPRLALRKEQEDETTQENNQ